MTFLRMKLAARAIARLGGGYGFMGLMRTNIRTYILMSSIIMGYMALQVTLRFEDIVSCTQIGGSCLSELVEKTVIESSGFLFFLVFLLVGMQLSLAFVIVPIAQSVRITPDLERLAERGVPEAAQALAELHADRGADAHALLWSRRAAALGHRDAIKSLDSK